MEYKACYEEENQIQSDLDCFKQSMFSTLSRERACLAEPQTLKVGTMEQFKSDHIAGIW